MEGFLVEKLDHEWIELIKEARDQGFTREEIIRFLQNPQLAFEQYQLQRN
ncbi:anti-repressor SinI family protein [Fictibacillus nanhaiensis]|uniref:Anti-repressor SinI family protein n=1 Tax=Fictibacillus nanhaiensis TaxID=742169 RepID=A0ABS2ZRC2_9BACL|nr:anti-repressor SinI family protein [Fictibacillus nanhaiensis]